MLSLFLYAKPDLAIFLTIGLPVGQQPVPNSPLGTSVMVPLEGMIFDSRRLTGRVVQQVKTLAAMPDDLSCTEWRERTPIN